MASIPPSVTPRPDRSQPHGALFVGEIALVLIASWSWLAYQDWAMRHMDFVDMAMPSRGPWTRADLALVFVMWAVMMVAMMVPSALPMLLAFRRTDAARGGVNGFGRRTALFAIGYLAVWTAFSAAATLAQWGLHLIDQISGAMVLTSPWVGAAVLIAAGVYQWTPLKNACLGGCRSPLAFLLNRWRAGSAGALRMGLEHGAFCTGCCWLLMAILFVVGVMNVAWIVALTLYVLVEKITPPGRWLTLATGAVLIGWGVWVALAGV